MSWTLYHPADGETGTEVNPYLYCSPSPFYSDHSVYYYLSDGQKRETPGQYGSWYPPVTLTSLTAYTWYAKEYSELGVLVSTSPTYSFTTLQTPPTKATTPSPTDESITVTLNRATISWVNGGGADSYDVYYDEGGSPILVSEGQTGTSFTITGITSGSPFDYAVTRYWRIDSINAAGTTTGDTWSFTTISYDPPKPSGATTWDAINEHWEGTLTGENNIATIKRLVIASDDMIWYEQT